MKGCLLKIFHGFNVKKKYYFCHKHIHKIIMALFILFKKNTIKNKTRLWLAKQIQNYKYGRMTEERCAMMIEIFNLLDTNAKRI